jgi:hypothetical protein
LPARLIGIEECAFELGPDAFRLRADRRRGDKPGIGPPAGEQPLEIIGRHQHIRIGKHNPVVARRPPALEHIVKLRIAAHVLIADEEPRVGFRLLRHQRFDQRDDGVLCRSHAE